MSEEYLRRPLPQVFTTPEYESVRAAEEPVSVRVYASFQYASVVKLSRDEAKVLADELLKYLEETA